MLSSKSYKNAILHFAEVSSCGTQDLNKKQYDITPQKCQEKGEYMY